MTALYSTSPNGLFIRSYNDVSYSLKIGKMPLGDPVMDVLVNNGTQWYLLCWGVIDRKSKIHWRPSEAGRRLPKDVCRACKKMAKNLAFA